MNYKMLKKARVIISLLFFILTIALFLDIYELYAREAVHKVLFLQFVPSLLLFLQSLALGATGFILIIVLTVFLGRFYCSAICPLGILQDVIAWIAKKRSKAKFFYKRKRSYSLLRYSILGISIVAFFISFSTLISLLDPYSNFGRIMTYLFRPIAVLINNGVATVLHKFEVYSLNPVKLITAPWLLVLFTLAVFITLAYMSYKRGRLFCNTICPVGTLLGLLSKVSFLKIRFKESNCTKCVKVNVSILRRLPSIIPDV